MTIDADIDCFKQINKLEKQINTLSTQIEEYKNKANKHKKYFNDVWFTALIIMINIYDFYYFLPVLALGIVSISYVQSSYLNLIEINKNL